jgi:glycosyltransferase involved in cell wall biosynthesis
VSGAAAAVSVIVPARDAAGALGACLDALAAQQDAPAFEVIVVDDASRDGTAAVAGGHAAVSAVLRGPGRGSYAARNVGVSSTTAPVVAFTDADCVPDARWLAEGTATLGAGADLAGGAVRPLARDRERPNSWERYDAAVYLDQEHLVEADGFAATANLFVRRPVFDAVGLFDERLRSSGDYEFGRRATGAGFRLVFAPAAIVGHASRASLASTWRLHRRLGAGWRTLSAVGKRPARGDDLALRLALGTVVDRAAARGTPVRRREVAHVHAVAMAARWTGHLTGR